MPKRIAYLDGIRILSSIIVCIAHSIQIFILPKLGANSIVYFVAGQAASYAVVVFFLLSGFMVTNSIFNNNEQNGKFNFLKYWKDRFLRLYPPLIFAILLCIFIFIFIKFFHLHGSISYKLPGDISLARDLLQYSVSEILVSLFFIQGIINYPMYMNGPLWTLGDEFVLYVMASLFSLIFLNKMKVLPLIFLTLLIWMLVHFSHFQSAAYLYCVWGIGSFFSIEKHHKNEMLGVNSILILILVSLTIALIILVKYRFHIPPIDYLFSLASLFQISIILFVIFLYKYFPNKWQNRISFAISKITPQRDFTYTLYIIHFPILLFCFSLTHEWLNINSTLLSFITVLFILPIIIIMSSMLSKYIENRKWVLVIFEHLKRNKVIKNRDKDV